MTDEIFRSMKEQMVPSDECVNDLLNKIAALEASSVNDNVVSMDRYKVVDMNKPDRQKRPLWKVISTIAACLVVLVGSIAVFGTDEDQKANDAISKVLPEQVVTTVKDIATPTENQDADDQTAVVDEEKDSKPEAVETAKEEANKEAKPEIKDEEQAVQKQKTESKPEGSEKNSPVSQLAWSKEILSEEAVSSINIDGNEYKVNSVKNLGTSNDFADISLDLDEAKVNAKAMTVENVSEELMLAVKADGIDGTLVYMNSNYLPNDLGELIEDAGFTTDLTFTNTVYCEIQKTDHVSRTSRPVENLSSLVNTYLFSNTAAEPSGKSMYREGASRASFTSKNNATGQTIKFGASSNGYLYIKFSEGNGYTFNIGEENANAFIHAIVGE